MNFNLPKVHAYVQRANAAAPDTPVFLLHLYDSAMLNKAAIHALGMDKNTPNPLRWPDCSRSRGNPTGLLVAEPNALILYSTIANAPKLAYEDQLNSSSTLCAS